MFNPDPLVRPESLFPLAETRGGGHRPVEHVPGVLRPFSATLAVVPIECGKHETTATRFEKDEATEKSRDGFVEYDSVPVVHTDS